MADAKKILAIDDQRDNLTTIHAVLKGKLKNCTILTALSGKEGIEIAKKEQPDTILLDIIMPQMDGYEVCKLLKEDEQTKHIPVVMITAIKTDVYSRVKALDLGADAFLSKPIDSVELIAQVNVMLRIKEAEDKLRAEKEALEVIVSKKTTELRESNEKYMALYENAPLPYQSLNEDGSFRDVNPAWLTTLGYNREEVIGKFYKDFLHPDWKVQFESNYPKFKKRGHVSGVQYKICHKNGEYLDIEFEGCIGYNPDGSFNQTYCVFQDITERKQAEEALLYEQYLLHSLMDNSPDVIYFKDINSRFVRINKAHATSFGLNSPQEAIGKSDFDFFTDEHAKKAFNDEQEIIRTGNPIVNKEERKTWMDGRTTWSLSTKLPLRLNEGKIVGTFGISRDITERKNKEKELIEAKEKAEESDRLKSAFLANMSHEIRTPMNGILGFAELLKSPGLTGEQQQEYIEIIEKSGERMLNIINDIVDISKIEAGLMRVVKHKTNINHLINDIFDFFRKEAEDKMLEIEYKTGLPDPLAVIQTDNEKIYAILTNLVKNAIKYSDSGKITFGYELLKDPGSGMLQFYIKDEGIGIPYNRIDAIFERFIQADISDKRAFQGAGLGLAISRAYVEALGGKIWVKSKEGIGSTFYFTIPYNIENTTTETTNTREEQTKVNKLKILIVEDDKTSEQLIEIILSPISKEILKAKNGHESVEICKENPDIDLLIMDIQMPEMNGTEATMLIRSFNPDVIIIAQTAYALPGDKEKAIAAGCNDYISKPIDKVELLSLIRKYYKK